MAYLIMARLGRLVTSLPMSLITLYQSQIVCDGLASLAFSQSGQSPDLVAPTRFFTRRRRAHRGLRQRRRSPLAQAAQWVFPLHAGAETSVAATKSFIAQLVAGARLVAAWQDDLVLQAALSRPARRAGARCACRLVARRSTRCATPTACSSSAAAPACRSRMEAALKFKETCAHPGRGVLRRRGASTARWR